MQQHEFCENLARSYMVIAKAILKKYGRKDPSFVMYVKLGINCCKMAVKMKEENKKYLENTVSFNLAA